MDDDDEWGFEDTAINRLHGLAHHVVCGRLVGVPIILGFRLVDALRSLELDEIGATAYVRKLSEARERGEAPRWD